MPEEFRSRSPNRTVGPPASALRQAWPGLQAACRCPPAVNAVLHDLAEAQAAYSVAPGAYSRRVRRHAVEHAPICVRHWQHYRHSQQHAIRNARERGRCDYPRRHPNDKAGDPIRGPLHCKANSPFRQVLSCGDTTPGPALRHQYLAASLLTVSPPTLAHE